MRFWALISFTGGYAMHLVNPADNGEGKRWGFDFHGYAENAFMLYLVGAALAVLIFFVPFLTSLNQSQKRVASRQLSYSKRFGQVLVSKDMANLIRCTSLSFSSTA